MVPPLSKCSNLETANKRQMLLHTLSSCLQKKVLTKFTVLLWSNGHCPEASCNQRCQKAPSSRFLTSNLIDAAKEQVTCPMELYPGHQWNQQFLLFKELGWDGGFPEGKTPSPSLTQRQSGPPCLCVPYMVITLSQKSPSITAEQTLWCLLHELIAERLTKSKPQICGMSKTTSARLFPIDCLAKRILKTEHNREIHERITDQENWRFVTNELLQAISTQLTV